jgi:hypothetical protein
MTFSPILDPLTILFRAEIILVVWLFEPTFLPVFFAGFAAFRRLAAKLLSVAISIIWWK